MRDDLLLNPLNRRDVLKGTAYGITLAALLAACGGNDDSGGGTQKSGPYTAPASSATGTLTISNWGDPKDKEVYSGAMTRFKAKYPNVTVNDNFTPITTWSEYINKLVTQVAAGKAPDIINVAIEGIRLGLDKKLFRPLDDYVKADPAGAKLTADVDKRLLDGLSYQGKLYFLPNTWNTMLIYYNTKMFQQAGLDKPADGWTWDDFLASAKKLTTGSGGSKVYGFALPWFNFGLTPWFYSNGTAELNADMSASNMTDPKMVEAVTFVRDLVTKEGVAPQPKGADPYQLFPAGKAAMTGAGHWVVGDFAKAGFSDYDVVPWPQKTTKSSVYGVSGFGIYPGSKNTDLAWEYIKELAGPESQKGWVSIGAANPALRSAAESPEFQKFPANATAYYDAIEYAKPVQAPTVFNVLEPSVMRAMDSVMSGTDPAAALAKSGQEIDNAFKSQ
jgi:multiple sugar transport system substrate-binding protein